MRLNRFILLSIIFVTVIMVLVLWVTPASIPPKSSPQVWAEYQSASGVHAYVVGHYIDYWNGWSVTFNFQDTNGLWHAYYLDHESKRWRNVQIEPADTEGKLRVRRGGQLVAEYAYHSNLFYDARAKHQYAPHAGVETVKLSTNLVALFSKHQKLP